MALKNKKYFFIFLYLLTAATLLSQLPSLQWAKHIGGTSNTYPQAIITDKNGNVYTTGSFDGSTDFDPGPAIFGLTSNGGVAGGEDIYITKLDPAGNFVWAKSLGASSGVSSDRGLSVSVDGFGNVYTTGFFFGTVDFNPGVGNYPLTSQGSYDAFILKLNASGNFVWVKQIGGSGNDQGSSIITDSIGNSFVTGYFNNIAIADPPSGTILNGTNSNNAFICRIDSLGNFIWIRQFNNSEGVSITSDKSFDIYATGYFNNTVDFGLGAWQATMSAVYPNEIFILKLSAQGVFKKVTKISGPFLKVSSIATDNSFNIYTMGSLITNADFVYTAATYTLNNADSSGHLFISKLDSAYNLKWVKKFGSKNYDIPGSITADYSGNIYSTGEFTGVIDLDPGPGSYTLAPQNNRLCFISKLDSAGNFIWAAKSGGQKSLSNALFTIGRSLIIDDLSNIYITGSLQGLNDFDITANVYNMSAAGNIDMYISKLNNPSVGINDPSSASSYKVYPNPFSDWLNVETSQTDNFLMIELKDLIGQTLLKEYSKTQTFTLFFSSLHSGIYFVKITDKNNTTKIYKLVKQN